MFETFGLVVTEALSAGLPCALSDIPVFRSLFSDCPGVVFLSGDEEQDVAAINRLLERAPDLRQQIEAFWHERFRDDVVTAAWTRFLARISGDESGRACTSR